MRFMVIDCSDTSLCVISEKELENKKDLLKVGKNIRFKWPPEDTIDYVIKDKKIFSGVILGISGIM